MGSAIERGELAIGHSPAARDFSKAREGFGSHTITYALGGALLGVGAPVGALLLRVLDGARISADLRENAFFYLYQLVGTCLVFAVMGVLAGRRADQLRHRRDEYRELSERDSLTNLVNARAFWSRYERAVEHAARFHEPLSLLLIDIDQLKRMNDELGHAFGSASLLHVGKVLESSKRGEDTAARWGGDEFAVLMLGAGKDAALRQAEEILERLRAEPVRVDGRDRLVSVTIGVATAAPGEARNLFEAADRALYEGKTTGRGQVRTAEA